MDKLIDSIKATKDAVKKAGDTESPHVGNALSALDAAVFHLRNEQHRLQAEKVEPKGGSGNTPAR